jgi:hypothetical protein
MEAGEVFAYEALVRGPNGEPASSVLGALKAENLYRFDCEARSVAVRLAASLGLRCGLSLNFLPRTLDAIPDGISSTQVSAVYRPSKSSSKSLKGRSSRMQSASLRRSTRSVRSVCVLRLMTSVRGTPV